MNKFFYVFRFFGYVGVFFLYIVSVQIGFTDEGKIELHEETLQCRTCEYISEQRERIRMGKKPVEDTRFVPEGFWSKEGSFQLDGGVWQWPNKYVGVNDNRIDSDGDGLRECWYKVDFSGFVNDGLYTQQEVDLFLSIFYECIDVYNQVLQHVGLEFMETTDSNHHVMFQATSDAELGSSIGLSTLFGAWYSDSPICKFRSSYSRFGALRHLLDQGAPNAVYKNPPGSPYVYVFGREDFYNQAERFTYDPISETFLHEIGHLMGLHHPFDSIYDSINGADSDYHIDWLAKTNVTNNPPHARSTVLSGEDFGQTGWSRSFINTFMTYDLLPRYALFPDIPPPTKAFIAHYYGIDNPVNAQVLFDQALAEHNAHSPLAMGGAIESEPNDQSSQANEVQIGQTVLGALSSRDSNDTLMLETYGDSQDWYHIEVHPADVGRFIDVELQFASTEYGNFYYTSNGVSYDGDCLLQAFDASGNLVGNSNTEEFPIMRFEPTLAGEYKILVRNPLNAERKTKKDYLMTIEFMDGNPPTLPTATPIISETPTLTPTPLPQIIPTNTPTRTPSPSPSHSPTPVPAVTPEPTVKRNVFVYDHADADVDLTGRTDFDPLDDVALTIKWDIEQGNATSWDIYVRKGLGGPKFLGRVADPAAKKITWGKDAQYIMPAFNNGPDLNAAYSFRVIRLDDQLTSDDFVDQAGFVGLNLEGGNNVPVTQPAIPNLNPGEIVVYDDLLGGNNLAPVDGIGVDTDSSDWRALQIAWNFGVHSSEVRDYQLLIRKQDEQQFTFIGQTNNGSINYYWWTQDQKFKANSPFDQGPQDGEVYQFQVVMFPFNGSPQSLTSGMIQYNVEE